MSIDRVQTWQLGIDPTDPSCPQAPFALATAPAAGQGAAISIPARAGKTIYLQGFEWSCTTPAVIGATTLTIATPIGGANFSILIGVNVVGPNIVTRDYGPAPMIGPGQNAALFVGAVAIAGVSQALNVWGFYQ
jgi:hypothetical protein